MSDRIGASCAPSGETLRPHEVQKLQQKSELEDRSVMHKVRLGCRRYDLKAAFESSTVEA